jgi:NAD(P) transhydrogenase
MTLLSYDYDLFVIGSGPAGQWAAIQAARLGKRVAIAEKKTSLETLCTEAGTISSKMLREAILNLTKAAPPGLAAGDLAKQIDMLELGRQVNHICRSEFELKRRRLNRAGIEVLQAKASFIDPHTLRLVPVQTGEEQRITAEMVLIAVGTQIRKPAGVPFDGQRVFSSDDIFTIPRPPASLLVVGGGIIGLEYASLFNALGVPVTLVDRHAHLLDFVDSEIVHTLMYLLRHQGMTFFLGEEATQIEVVPGEAGQAGALVHLASGQKLRAEMALYAAGRVGAVERLNLPAAGLEPDLGGRLRVDAEYRTGTPNIFAAGDIIGFPSLGSTAMEQGRLAVCHAFGVPTESNPDLFPYGIYTIPEISTVGKNEEELARLGIPYQIGKARYREIIRGQMAAGSIGLLKLLFHPGSRKLFGVHIIGEGASELIHIGQAVLSFGGTIDYFTQTVFNYPTLAETYRLAAQNGLSQLS